MEVNKDGGGMVGNQKIPHPSEEANLFIRTSLRAN